jgi:hypothetical protein
MFPDVIAYQGLLEGQIQDNISCADKGGVVWIASYRFCLPDESGYWYCISGGTWASKPAQSVGEKQAFETRISVAALVCTRLWLIMRCHCVHCGSFLGWSGDHEHALRNTFGRPSCIWRMPCAWRLLGDVLGCAVNYVLISRTWQTTGCLSQGTSPVYTRSAALAPSVSSASCSRTTTGDGHIRSSYLGAAETRALDLVQHAWLVCTSIGCRLRASAAHIRWLG